MVTRYEIKEAKIVQICEKSLEDGSKLLEEMDSEARSAPLQYRSAYLHINQQRWGL